MGRQPTCRRRQQKQLTRPSKPLSLSRLRVLLLMLQLMVLKLHLPTVLGALQLEPRTPLLKTVVMKAVTVRTTTAVTATTTEDHQDVAAAVATAEDVEDYSECFKLKIKRIKK